MKVWSLLRSRRVAAFLLLAFVAYAVLNTIRPGEDFSKPYGSPLFLGLIGWLTLSTAACAWERTGRALRLSRGIRQTDDRTLERLMSAPQARVDLHPGSGDSSILAEVARALKGEGLRIEAKDRLVHGRRGVWTLWASPVFHWSLAALVVVVSLGQLTRSEGWIALPMNERIVDAHESYIQLEDGRWFGERHTGLSFEMLELDRTYSRKGVNYGPTPLVAAYKDDVEVKRTWIHPNNPLRIGAMLMHYVEYGPAVVVGLERQGAGEFGRATVPLDRSAETSSGTTAEEIQLAATGNPADSVKVRIQVPVTRGLLEEAPAFSRAIIETASAGSDDFGEVMVLSEGEALDLPGGQRLRIVEVKDWVRVSAVTDWSVPVIYGLLVLAIGSLSVAVLGSARRVSVLLVSDESGQALHEAAWDSRRSSGFKERVATILSETTKQEEM